MGDFIPDDVVLVHHVMVLRETNVGIRLGVPLAGVTSLLRHGIPHLERISAALQILLIQPKYSIHIISHIRSIKPDALNASVEAPGLYVRNEYLSILLVGNTLILISLYLN